MSHDFSSVPSQVNPAPYSPAPSHFSQSSMADQQARAQGPPGQQHTPTQQPQQQQPPPPPPPPQQGAYASPHSYPSPTSMQPTYSYPPPGPPAGEPYRGSPPGANMSLPPLNLPPIRLQDGQQPPPPQPQHQHPHQQHHQQHQPPPPQQQMGSPLPPPQHAMQQHYPPPGYAHPGQPMNMGPAQYNPAMRYQLPPQGDQRVLSGGRHKKEIKRRTKTGCLTCRKRRIKVSADFNGLRLADAS